MPVELPHELAFESVWRNRACHQRRRPLRLIGRAQHQSDGLRQPLPVEPFGGQLRPALPRQAVELGVATGLRRPPLGPKPAAVLEPVQRGVQRALLHLEGVFGDLLQTLPDGVAVERSERNDLQQQQVERALKKIGLRALSHDDA